jgi:glycosyltransferase involved in cell wall biosynthesis
MTAPPASIWCGIPVYNNAATIFEIARKCREQLAHVIVVDDGSTDADLTQLLSPLDVIVIRHPQNRGKGQALLSAFQHAQERGAAYLITLDGDGQHFPEDIPKFLPHLSPDTLLIGYRDQITGEMPRSSQFGRAFSDFWIRLEAGANARDTQSGFRAYPLAAVQQLQLRSHFYNFEMEIITKAIWAGLRVRGVPVRVWYPPATQRVSSFDPFQDNLRISLLHTRLVLWQLLPIWHRKIIMAGNQTRSATNTPPAGRSLNGVLYGDSTPIGLAVSAGLSVLMSIVLWPWGFFAVAYVTTRLHLNKIVALLCVLACMPKIVPRLCSSIGRMLVTSKAHPTWQWIVGAHVVAIPLALLVGWIVYQFRSRTLPGNTSV